MVVPLRWVYYLSKKWHYYLLVSLQTSFLKIISSQYPFKCLIHRCLSIMHVIYLFVCLFFFVNFLFLCCSKTLVWSLVDLIRSHTFFTGFLLLCKRILSGHDPLLSQEWKAFHGLFFICRGKKFQLPCEFSIVHLRITSLCHHFYKSSLGYLEKKFFSNFPSHISQVLQTLNENCWSEFLIILNTELNLNSF